MYMSLRNYVHEKQQGQNNGMSQLKKRSTILFLQVNGEPKSVRWHPTGSVCVSCNGTLLALGVKGYSMCLFRDL